MTFANKTGARREGGSSFCVSENVCRSSRFGEPHAGTPCQCVAAKGKKAV
jgi:hypothetical protein